MVNLHRFRVSVAALVLLASGPSNAQEHIAIPPVNLGASSFMDGPGGPGLLTREVGTFYDAQRFTEGDGRTAPGDNTLVTVTEITHLQYSPPIKVLGGYWGVEVLVPVATVDLTMSAAKARATGLGDITFSPLVFQAPNLRLFGGSFFHRLDVDVNAPTGEYRREAAANVGSHVWSVNPYYAFTWLPFERLETSWRLHYLWNSANDDAGSSYGASTIQPGQVIHVNGAVSARVAGPVRAGVAGYLLQQITDSLASGRPVAGSRERVAALGPGLDVFAGGGSTQLTANAYWEFAVENRPVGTRLNLVVLHVW
jgi:hypothetical protein